MLLNFLCVTQKDVQEAKSGSKKLDEESESVCACERVCLCVCAWVRGSVQLSSWA